MFLILTNHKECSIGQTHNVSKHGSLHNIHKSLACSTKCAIRTVLTNDVYKFRKQYGGRMVLTSLVSMIDYTKSIVLTFMYHVWTAVIYSI